MSYWISPAMNVRMAVALVVVLGPFACASIVNAAEKFQRLTGAQIQARFSGMEASDNVHWRDTFERNGTVTSQSMGKKRTGKWRVEKNELCIDLGKDSGGCYQVWLAGRKFEFRLEGLGEAFLEGTLQKPIRK